MEQLKVLEDKSMFFTKITTSDREKVKRWLNAQRPRTGREQCFLEVVQQAVCKIQYDYWIATLEPSVKRRQIYYSPNEKVSVFYKGEEWIEMASEFAPERKSRLARLNELFVWYALRIANGLWSLDYVANNSSCGGNYRKAPRSSKSIERAGTRLVGGYHDGQGNTAKIVMDNEFFFKPGLVIVGGCCYDYGDDYPVAKLSYNDNPKDIYSCSTGVVVLLTD